MDPVLSPDGPRTTLLDLPQDILDLIFPYLPPRSFLNFCSINQDTYRAYRVDPLYWRTETSSTFRLPISPLLHADGSRWHWLYKKLRTQSRPFTWGEGLYGGLGPGAGLRDAGRGFKPRGVFERLSSSWPTEVYVREEVGVIVDLQAGGWSTSILTADGKLYAVGVLARIDGRVTGDAFQHFTRLHLCGSHSSSGIRQFSAGRYHILGRDDHGYVWSWDRIERPGRMISFRHGIHNASKASRVVAG